MLRMTFAGARHFIKRTPEKITEKNDTIVFPLYSRTGLRTAPSVAHLDSLGIAPLGLFSAQYENKLKTLYVLGFLDNRLHAAIFTPRPDGIRMISLRKANAKEIRCYENHTRL